MTVKEKILEYLEKERKGALNLSAEYLIAKMPDSAAAHEDNAEAYARASAIIKRRMAGF